MNVAARCYAVTQGFPSAERYGLTAQMRRSAVSIPSNIAEGCGRGTDREFAHFLRIAYGSACELETQALLAAQIGLGSRNRIEALVDETNKLRRKLNRLITRVSAET